MEPGGRFEGLDQGYEDDNEGSMDALGGGAFNILPFLLLLGVLADNMTLDQYSIQINHTNNFEHQLQQSIWKRGNASYASGWSVRTA